VLERTEGVTASFLKELLRRAAVLSAAADEGQDAALAVTADQLDEALAELLDTRNTMTRVLLGSAPASRARSQEHDADLLDDLDEGWAPHA
jgi:hypothetical protein